jgi:hypothetical protein
MLSQRLALSVLVVFGALTLHVPAEASSEAHSNEWKSWSGSSSCLYNGANDKEFKCPFTDQDKPTTTLTISSKVYETRLTYDEYHLGNFECNLGGGPVIHAFYVVQKGKPVTLDVLNAGRVIRCRVSFVKGCDYRTSDSGDWNLDVPCKDVIEVSFNQWRGNTN